MADDHQVEDQLLFKGKIVLLALLKRAYLARVRPHELTHWDGCCVTILIFPQQENHTLSELTVPNHVLPTPYQQHVPENPVDLSSSRPPPHGQPDHHREAALIAHHHGQDPSKSRANFPTFKSDADGFYV